jgi:predicted metal-dependent HD superfamily phosphohydrolase
VRADLGQLRERWRACCHGIAQSQQGDAVFGELLAAYTGPDRHYHDIDHIADCLREFDSVKHLAENPAAVEAAIWFHDVVYDGRCNDNEEQSSEVAGAALRQMGAGDAFRGQVIELILLTRHNVTPASKDGKLMVDIDLASLALAPQRFEENSRRIRAEYPHVPDEAFVRGRDEMLGGFLRRPRIYYSDVFFNRYERQARENLRRAVSHA